MPATRAAADHGASVTQIAGARRTLCVDYAVTEWRGVMAAPVRRRRTSQCAVPEMVGGELLAGGAYGTTGVGSDVAVALPTELVAVTATRMVLAASAACTT